MGKFCGTALLLAAGGALLLDLCGVSVCDGTYDLEVSVSSASGAAIEEARCDVFPSAQWALTDPDQAEQVLSAHDFKERSPAGLSWQVAVRPFAGQPLRVAVPCTDRVSVLLERHRGHSQYRALMVQAVYNGGKCAGKLVPIPDAGVARSLAVSLP